MGVILGVSVGVSVGGTGVHVAVKEGVRDGVAVNVAGAKMDKGLPRQLTRNNISSIHKAIFLFCMSRLYPSL